MNPSVRSRLKAWLEVARLKFFTAGIPPAILGTVIAWHYTGSFDLSLFILTLAGLSFAMAGCYMFNEYFDWESGVDLIIDERDVTPFNAGSRVLPRGELEPHDVFRAGAISYLLALIIGLYLTWLRGWLVLMLAAIGLITGTFYTAPPFRWAYRGIGEALIGLTYGPFIVIGSYYVQAPTSSLIPAILPSFVPGFLITAVIWINEFPDYNADRVAGKMNMVIRMGRTRATWIYYFLITTPYLLTVAGTIYGALPPASLLLLVTSPLAIKSASILKKSYDKPKDLAPAMAGTILLFVSATLLMAGCYMITI